MTITEPATLITDWLLAAQCTVLARRLECDGPAARLLRIHLLVAAVGALLGGLDHGFQLHLSAEASRWIWTGTLAALVVASQLVAILGAAIQALELAPHPAFNHNDLFHVVQMGAILLLVRGAREVLPPAAANLGA